MLRAGAGSTSSSQTAPGEVVALSNVHLPAGPYSPNLVRRGAKRSTILEIERRVRVPAVEPSVTALTVARRSGHPRAAARRLQHAIAPGLDAGDGRAPRPDPLSGQLANEPVRRGGGIRRLLPCGASRPGREPGADVAVRQAAPAGRVEPGAERPGRSDRLHLHGGRDRDARQRPGRRVGRSGRHDRGRSVGDRPPRDRVRALGGGRVLPTLVSVGSRLIESGTDQTLTFHGPGGPDQHVVVFPASAIRRIRWPTSRCPAVIDGTVDIETDGWDRGHVRRAPRGGSRGAFADALLGRGGGRRTARVDVAAGSTGSAIRSMCAGGTHRATDGIGSACTSGTPIPTSPPT